MAYSFTSSIKPYVISSLYEAMKTIRPLPRTPSTVYSVGSQVSNANIKYVCIQDGVTGTGNGPSNSSGATYDGTVRWLPIGTDNVQDGDVISNLYLGVGRQTEWTNPAVPDLPDTSVSGQTETLDELTALIKLDSSNFRLGLKNNVWATGTVYSQYDPEVTSYISPIYTVVGGVHVYKCLDNNSGAESTEPPSGTGTFLIETADGYIWKYVGTISGPELFTFGTTEFLPIPTTLTSTPVKGEISSFSDIVTTPKPFTPSESITVTIIGDGVGASAAPRTIAAGSDLALTGIYATAGGSGYSKAFAIAYNGLEIGTGATGSATISIGEISSIDVTAPGENYTTASVLIIGDGTGATATANISSGLINAIDVDNHGTGYTWARVFIIPGESGGVSRAKLSPPGGHGANIDTELGISSLLISARLSSSLIDYIPTEPNDPDGSFRQLSLVSGVLGSTKNALAYIGPSHPDYASGSQAKYQKGSGFVLYMNNIIAIDHTTSQEEVIKISISL